MGGRDVETAFREDSNRPSITATLPEHSTVIFKHRGQKILEIHDVKAIRVVPKPPDKLTVTALSENFSISTEIENPIVEVTGTPATLGNTTAVTITISAPAGDTPQRREPAQRRKPSPHDH